MLGSFWVFQVYQHLLSNKNYLNIYKTKRNQILVANISERVGEEPVNLKQRSKKRLVAMKSGLNSDRDVASSSVANTGVPMVKEKDKGKKKKGQVEITLVSELTIPTEALRLSAPKICAECGAKKFDYESLFFCCRKGGVKLAENAWPPKLLHLFTSEDEARIHFRAYCRMYNNLFAFTALGGNIEANTQKGIFVFKLHGQIYHYLPDLLPDGEQPKYLQMYFYDSEHEIMNWTSTFPEVRQDIVELLMEVMECNPHVRFFRSLRDLPVVENTEIHLNRNTVLDQRAYIAHTANEVVVIWSEDTKSSQYSSPHIIVYGKSEKSHKIMHYFGCYDPLQYPFLFPLGDCGWHEGLEKIDVVDDQVTDLQQEVCQLESIESVEDLLAEEAASNYIHVLGENAIQEIEHAVIALYWNAISCYVGLNN